MVRVSKIKDNTGMRTSSTTATSEDVIKINGAVEAQATVGEYVNPMALVITRSVEDRDLRYD